MDVKKVQNILESKPKSMDIILDKDSHFWIEGNFKIENNAIVWKHKGKMNRIDIDLIVNIERDESKKKNIQMPINIPKEKSIWNIDDE